MFTEGQMELINEIKAKNLQKERAIERLLEARRKKYKEAAYKLNDIYDRRTKIGE